MAMVRELGIRRGDHVLATVVGNCIAVAKIDPAKLLDQARVRSYGENVKNRGEP
jgi:bifunctional DNA-binding transcriptional regulator/antitoxin component of YhaV-PrlF toxin-antitoxin module